MTLLIFGDVDLSFGVDLTSLSLSPSSPSSSQRTKVGLPRERERVKKKVGVFMAELSFLNRGVSVLK